MNFNFFTETAEADAKRFESKKVLKDTLEYFFEYINSVQSNNPEVTIEDIISDVKDDLKTYLENQTTSTTRIRVIETYLNKRIFSLSKYNINTAYKEICTEILEGKLDLSKYESPSLKYTFNFDEDIKILACAMLAKIIKEKEKVRKYIDEREELKDYDILTKKELNSVIRKLANGNADQEKRLKQIVYFDSKSEKDLLVEEYKKYTKDSADKFKDECINSIMRNIEFMDKYKLIDNSTKFSNILYKNIYIHDYKFSVEEVKESLKSSNLKKLSTEQLLALDAYWSNRVSKTVNELHKGIYILSHPELYETKKLEDGTTEFKVSNEDMSGVELKANILQKLTFEQFRKMEYEATNGTDMDVSDKIKEAGYRYGNEYKEYLGAKLPNCDNDLVSDMEEGLLFQNIAYNIYKFKTFDMQALLAILLNNESKTVTNFGYIDDGKNYRFDKKFILIGADIPGMNMPFKLHMSKNSLLEVVQSVQKGNTKLQEYVGDSDFKFAKGAVITCKMLVPLSEEKKEKLKINAKSVTPKDKYGKTVEHLNYIAGNGKTPKRLCGKKTYVEINEIENELER